MDNGHRLAAAGGMTKEIIMTDDFRLVSFLKSGPGSDVLRVYIEGDGFAWETPRRLSLNPTPIHPVALGLAIEDASENVAYLARPCQYLNASEESKCDSAYWSAKRFAPEVLRAMDQAVSHLMQETGCEKVELIGYSGGGALAVLLAARREDVVSLRTVAGNIDPTRLNAHHGASPFAGSLDPMDAVEALKRMPQRHFVGGKDKTVPPFVAEGFGERMGEDSCFSETMIPAASHGEGWRERWGALLVLPWKDGC